MKQANMLKTAAVFLAAAFFITFLALGGVTAPDQAQTPQPSTDTSEYRAVWFSYTDLQQMLVGKTKAQFILAVDSAFSHCKDLGLNRAVVQVRPFSYAMMGGESIENADLYIVGASQAETYRDWFGPLPQGLQNAGEVMEMNGIPMGVKVYDAATRTGAAAAFILYEDPSKPAEDYYLFCGIGSLHVQGHENALDDQAVSCALQLMELP